MARPSGSDEQPTWQCRSALSTAGFVYEVSEPWVPRARRGSPAAGFETDPFFDYLEFSDAEVVARVGRPQRRTLVHLLAESLFCESIYSTSKMMDEADARAFVGGILAQYGVEPPPTLAKMSARGAGDFARCVAPQDAAAAFHILFQDRVFLRVFGERVAGGVKSLKAADHPKVLARDGVVRRCTVPKWLFRGVFFRDQGRCVLCRRDLSGILHPEQVLELDHIVPLALGGTNDPTNFQLLCQTCNADKRHHSAATSDAFIPFWATK